MKLEMRPVGPPFPETIGYGVPASLIRFVVFCPLSQRILEFRYSGRILTTAC